MAQNLSGGIDRFEAGGLKQFTLTATVTRPFTVTYVLLDPLGNSLDVRSISGVNSGVTVQESGAASSLGLYHIEYALPDTAGFYTQKWFAYDVASRPGIVAEEFEIVRTEPTSFFSYGNMADILRTARQIFGRGDITPAEIQDYMQPSYNRINAMIGTVQGITIPVSPIPPIMREWEKSLTLWAFHSDRFGVNREDAPSGLANRYDQAIEEMTAVQSGNAILDVASGVAYQAAYDIESTTETYKPIFDMRDWESQVVDPDLVAADASAAGTSTDEEQ